MANSSFNQSSINSSNGLILNAGRGGTKAGDVNSDGINDIIGVNYVVFGGANIGGSDGTINVRSLNGTNGFVLINGGSSVIESVSGAGDINGDGFDDVVIGNPEAAPNGVGNPSSTNPPSNFMGGQSYIVFGSANVGSSGLVDLSNLDGKNGFTVNGFFRKQLGASVSDAGDVNDDGFDDLIIGAPQWSLRGSSYVIFGSPNVGSSGKIDIRILGNNGVPIPNFNGTNGVNIFSDSEVSNLGWTISNAGDVNGDGIDDIILGESRTSTDLTNQQGKSYVIFGSKDIGGDGSKNLSSLNGTNGFVINGIGFRDFSGNSVSDAGDVNGDGFDDVIIGARLASPNGSLTYAGQSYVIFGSATVGESGIFNLSSLNGTNGFIIDGIASRDLLGSSVNDVGDINNDGFDDIVIEGSSQSYIIFGAPNVGSGGTINLSSLNGTNGFAINGISSISSAGDINNDGIDDIIGASGVENSIIYGNITPTLDLDSTTSGINYTTNFSGIPVSVVEPANLILTDNNETLTSATVTITNLFDSTAESLSANTKDTSITANYEPTTGVLTLTGTDKIANYQKVLQSLIYNNTSEFPKITARNIEFVVDDGQAFANTNPVATTTLSIGRSLNLEFGQRANQLQTEALQNGFVIEQSLGEQNGIAADIFPFFIFALDSDDKSAPEKRREFVDRTLLDQGEGIGITDGEDSTPTARKRIEKDEILGIVVAGFEATAASI